MGRRPARQRGRQRGAARSDGDEHELLPKLLFDAAWRRAWSPRAARAASAAGYVTLEAIKEIPYYAGAFGSALVTDDVDAAEAIIFLAGTNFGAAVYETGLARLTRRGLAWWPARRATVAGLDVRRDSGMKLTVAAAIGRGRTELAAFDNALVVVGAANFNLVRLSSVIPPHSTVVEASDAPPRPQGTWGDRLYVVYA